MKIQVRVIDDAGNIVVEKTDEIAPPVMRHVGSPQCPYVWPHCPGCGYTVCPRPAFYCPVPSQVWDEIRERVVWP